MREGWKPYSRHFVVVVFLLIFSGATGFGGGADGEWSAHAHRFGIWSEDASMWPLYEQSAQIGLDLVDLLDMRLGSSSESSSFVDNTLPDGFTRNKLGWILTKTFLNCLCNLIDLHFVAHFELNLP